MNQNCAIYYTDKTELSETPGELEPIRPCRTNQSSFQEFLRICGVGSRCMLEQPFGWNPETIASVNLVPHVHCLLIQSQFVGEVVHLEL